MTQQIQEIIETLKTTQVDGETMQYIIDQVGMTEQMHRQLVMALPIKNTLTLIEEKIDLYFTN